VKSVRRIAIQLVLATALLSLAPIADVAAADQPTGGGQWRAFQGTWIAAGSRSTLRLGGDRRASTAEYSGSLILSGPERPGAGFEAEALIFNDSQTGLIGRAVWTDDRGDQVYSELRGRGAVGTTITGTIVGGTGRYAGATGTYEFSWQFLIETEDGTVQGKSSGFTGRILVPSNAASSGGGTKQ
jgi:hypothetical protein